MSVFGGAAVLASPSDSSGQFTNELAGMNMNTANRHLYPNTMGGDGSMTESGGASGPSAKTNQNLGKDLAKKTPKLSKIIPATSADTKLTDAVEQQMVDDYYLKGNQAEERQTAATDLLAEQIANKELVGRLSEPGAWVKPAQAAAQAQATNAGNAAAEVSRDQASSAIDFCAHYLTNFTSDGGNKWNLLRNNIFVPMGILLLLPGALLTQLRAIMAAGNPVLGNVNPLEGIMRSVIAIFLIPGTYLVVNYSIDLSNSITFTINSEYFRLFGSDMYKDAICAEIRAFPVRGAQENRNALDLPVPAMTPMVNPGGLFAQFEGMMENKIEDPCSGIYQAPGARADEAMSSSSVAARLGLNGSNAALTASWNILCAFQMAYLYYLWFVGPVAAGLWVWPMKQLRGALPSWVEGVITLAFWSLFWNTAILLIACFKGVGETGCVLMTALHFLATASVKHAFDFAGLVRAAGQEAANMAEKAMKSGGAGGGAGGGGGGGSCGAKGGGAQGGGQAPGTAEGIGAVSSNGVSNPGNVSVAATSPVGAGERSFGSTGPVDKAGLSDAVASRSHGKGESTSAAATTPVGNPFDGKTSTDRTFDTLAADKNQLPPSAEKTDGTDLFNQESKYAAMFCSAELAGNFDGADIPLAGSDIDLDASTDINTDLSSVTNLGALTANENLKSLAEADADVLSTTLPPSAEALAKDDAQLNQESNRAEAEKRALEANNSTREFAMNQAAEKAKEAEEAKRNAAQQNRDERIAAAINNHLNNLGDSIAAVNQLNAGASAGAAVGADAVNNAALTASLMRDGISNFDVNNALTDINVASSSTLASMNLSATNVSNGWTSSDSLTSGDLARLELSDFSSMDALTSVDSIDASVVDNSLAAVSNNFDGSDVSISSLAAPAVGSLTQYGDVTTYGGVNTSDANRSDLSALVNTNSYTATDSYGAPIVTNSSPVPAMVSNQVDASSVLSNAVYSAAAVSGNVVAAVENFNTIPTGAHASLGQPGQSTTSEYYAAPAASGTVVGSVQPNAYAADYTVQNSSNSASSYSVDYSNPSTTASSSSYAVDYSNPSTTTTSSSYAVDYSNPSTTTTSSSYAVDYSNPSTTTASSSYAVDYSNPSTTTASSSYAVDYSSPSTTTASSSYAVDYSNQSTTNAATSYAAGASTSYASVDNSSANVQQSTPVFASVLPSSTPADYSAPAQNVLGGTQNSSNAEYYSAQVTPASSVVSSASSYTSSTSSYDSSTSSYASSTSSYSADYTAPSTPVQYVAASQQSATTEYAPSTQSAPVQGQPSSFIQPSGPANEYYAAASQSAPLVAALITPNQPLSVESAAVQAPQAYTSPVQYYLANASAGAEGRSVENIAPVERIPAQQPSDVVYSRSSSEAYTTVAPYQHVENSEPRDVSFAPTYGQNIQHGPHS
ncbi:MAG TPA: hypothetical protein V6C89_05605, partial [Drouetiella sp.]